MQTAQALLSELDKAGLTDAFMAKGCGLSQASITRIRRGEQEPGFNAYKRISEFHLKKSEELAKLRGKAA